MLSIFDNGVVLLIKIYQQSLNKLMHGTTLQLMKQSD